MSSEQIYFRQLILIPLFLFSYVLVRAQCAPSIGVTTFNNITTSASTLLASGSGTASVDDAVNSCWDITASGGGTVSIRAQNNQGRAGDDNLLFIGTASPRVNTLSFSSNDNSSFKLNGVWVFTLTGAGTLASQISLKGKSGGIDVPGAVLTKMGLSQNTWIEFDVSGDSDFDNVDEFELSVDVGEPLQFRLEDINISTAISAPVCSMTASITAQTNVACFGESTGSLTVTQSSGTVNFDYSWSNGPTSSNSPSSTNVNSSLAAGTYTVTVTDNNGCTATASATITQSGSALVATASTDNNNTCSGDMNGGTTASASGGTSPYTYNWSNGNTTAISNNLSAGTYSVTITDANGCTDSASTTVTDPSPLSAGSILTN